PQPPPNVIILTIDTLRADHLGCYGYFRNTSPNIDAFAAESILFERCIAPMATTLPVHTSLFTGVWPFEHGAIANVKKDRKRYATTPHLKRAAQVFKEAGYRTAAIVSALPLKKTYGLKNGFKTYDDPKTPQRQGAKTTKLALNWLREQPSDAPIFLWVHYFDPHGPFEAPEPYGSMFKSDEELEAHIAARGFSETALRPTGKKNILRPGLNRYDGEIRYTDDQVGTLLNHLRSQESWDNTYFLLLADHGESLNQHDQPGHGQSWNEQLHVPCILRIPGMDAGRNDSVISVVDLLPTLLSRLELESADDFLAQSTGVDVLTADYESRPILSQSSERQEILGGQPNFSLTTTRWKSIITEDGQGLLFDLKQDPHELADLGEERPEVLEKMRAHTLDMLRVMKQRGESLEAGKVVPLSEEDSKALRSLGYLGDDDE
ncbi:MAG: arylsulfatase A-like enzyme, partial [Planctomycetota bacterium]